MNCIYEAQNKEIYKLVNFISGFLIPGFYYAPFSGLALDPMDCISIGHFFANKQLDKVCIIDLSLCRVGDIGIEVFLKELSQRSMPNRAKGLELSLSGMDCSYLGVKCISETLSQTPVLRGLHFVNWIQYGLDAVPPLMYLIEGPCRESMKLNRITFLGCVTYKHTYHLVLLIAFSNLIPRSFQK